MIPSVYKNIGIFGIVIFCLCCIKCSEKLTAEEAFNRGKEYFQNNNVKMAYKYFKKALDKSKDNPQYHWAAARTAPNSNMAFIHTKAAWENGLKSFEVLLFLTKLSFHTEKKGKVEFALSLFEELPDKEKSEELRGDLFQRFEEYDSCLAIWEKLYRDDQTSELCNKMAIAYGKKGEKDKAFAILTECRKQKKLNSKGYITLAYLLALDYDYTAADELLNDAKQYGCYDDRVQLEHAGFLLLEERMEEAEPLLFDLIEPVNEVKETRLNRQARVILGYIYRANKDTEKIKHLIHIAKKTETPLSKAELLYYSSLCSFITDSGNALEQLKNAREQLTAHPVVDLIFARENAIAGNFTEAVSAYKNLPEVFLLSPAVLIETATALTKTGDYEGAFSLINAMHKKKRFTKNSLELFRDITFKMKFMKESEAAQKILESEYKDDAGIQYSRAVLSIKNGNTDKALEILSGLIKKYPQEKQFKIARITVYLAKEDYNRVIKECNKSRIDPYLLRQLKTRAYMKLGKFDMIESMYQELIKQKKSLAIMLEYAQLLVDSEEYDKAVVIFGKIVQEYGHELEKDPKKNALLLNNYAWALLNSKSPDKKMALHTAKKAYTLSSGDIHILDTYASVLIENNKFKNCINLLKENRESSGEPKLLYHLATAYDKTGDSNRALRAYQDVIKAINPSKNKLALPAEKSSIQKRINDLSSK